MKKPYVSPSSEVIQMETGNLLINASGITNDDIKEPLDGDTYTDEQRSTAPTGTWLQYN